MKGGAGGQQYQRFLPFRTAMAESKAFMRAIRAALGLAGTYLLEDLKKPFIVARVVPNLDAPEIKQAVAGSYLQSMGMLFEMPAAQPAALPSPPAAEEVPAYPDEEPGQLPWDEAPPEPPDTWSQEPGYGQWEPEPEPPQGIFCSQCRREITGGKSRNGRNWTPEDIAGYSQRTFGRVLCLACQEAVKGGQRR